jgi:syntaxin-binding protein 1
LLLLHCQKETSVPYAFVANDLFSLYVRVYSRFLVFSSRIASGASSDDESEYAASRYAPKLKFILEDWATNNLSLDEYPSVMPMPDMAPTASMGGMRGGKRGGGSATSAGSASSARSREASSARKSRGPSKNWSKSMAGSSSADGSTTGGADGPTRFTGGRAIVFTVGGMSFSELRVAREVSARESREIVAGSTAFISPSDFLEDLAKLGKDE